MTGRGINQDVGAGLFFAAFGGLFLFFGRDLPFGTAREMGAGYFPVVLGLLLILLGAGLAVKGLVVGGARIEPWALRPIALVCVALVLFAVLITKAGYLISATVCLAVTSLASREVRLRETAILIAVLVPLAGLLFVWLLGLPMHALPQVAWR